MACKCRVPRSVIYASYYYFALGVTVLCIWSWFIVNFLWLVLKPSGEHQRSQFWHQ
jgi:hypothetical protein